MVAVGVVVVEGVVELHKKTLIQKSSLVSSYVTTSS